MQPTERWLRDSLTYRRLWLGVGVLLIAAVTVLSLIPLPEMPAANLDKMHHLLAYGAIAGWFASCLRRRLVWVVMLLTAIWGLGVEVLQPLTGYRLFEPLDIVANSCGALIGGLLALTPLGQMVEMLDRRLSRTNA